VGKITIGFGLVLIALGIGAVVLTFKPTAAIPAGFGLVLTVVGYVAIQNEKARMHVMHAAVLVSLLGFLLPAVRVAMAIPGALSEGAFRHSNGDDATIAVAEQTVMALLCAAHVGLCVKSFIDARRSRRQAASSAGGQLPT
jgi:hypothetical protein